MLTQYFHFRYSPPGRREYAHVPLLQLVTQEPNGACAEHLNPHLPQWSASLVRLAHVFQRSNRIEFRSTLCRQQVGICPSYSFAPVCIFSCSFVIATPACTTKYVVPLRIDASIATDNLTFRTCNAAHAIRANFSTFASPPCLISRTTSACAAKLGGRQRLDTSSFIAFPA